MQITVYPGRAKGRIQLPPSKSLSHRALIAAAMAEGTSRITGLSDCDDVRRTADLLKRLGIDVTVQNGVTIVRGKEFHNLTPPDATLCCGESGSTLRFLIPPLMLCGKPARLSADGSLRARPMQVYHDLFSEDQFLEQDGEYRLCGPLCAGEYRADGTVSSQFFSGLLFALPCADGDSTLTMLPRTESRPYLDLTRSVLARFGINSAWTDERTISISGNQHYRPAEFTVEGDASAAANYAALNLLGGEVSFALPQTSFQGDAVYQTVFPRFCKETPQIDLRDTPDLAPIAFVLAALFHGATFGGTARLRYKESDRAAAMAEELSKCGVRTKIENDRMTVIPNGLHAPAEPLTGHGDHRVVMALTVLLTVLGGRVTDAETVAKSDPAFFQNLTALGICTEKEDQPL